MAVEQSGAEASPAPEAPPETAPPEAGAPEAAAPPDLDETKRKFREALEPLRGSVTVVPERPRTLLPGAPRFRAGRSDSRKRLTRWAGAPP